MEQTILVLGGALCLGMLAAGVALGMLVMLLYQIPAELRKFQGAIQDAMVPLQAALAQAAQAQRESVSWARRYSELMRTLGTGQPEQQQESREWRRQRRREDENGEYQTWNPDWMPNTEAAPQPPPPQQ